VGVGGSPFSLSRGSAPARCCCLELTHVDPRNDVLDGVQIPHGKGHFWGENTCMPVHYNVSIPQANVPTQRKRWMNAFAATRGDKSALRPFAKLLWTLVIITYHCYVTVNRKLYQLLVISYRFLALQGRHDALISEKSSVKELTIRLLFHAKFHLDRSNGGRVWDFGTYRYSPHNSVIHLFNDSRVIFRVNGCGVVCVIK